MIQAHELRIGNYLHDPKTGCLLKVIQIDIEGNISTYVMDRSKFPLPDGWSTSPIPLTPEILEKCGFDYKVNGFNHEFRRGKCDGEYLDFYLLNRHEPASYYELIHVIGKVKLVSKIWHLHQLQNLYFALTGEELEVNL